MITIRYKDKTLKRFNLKDYTAERKMKAAWYAMKDDPKYIDKAFQVKTKMGQDLRIRFESIEDVSCDESEYIEVKAENIGHINDRQKQKTEQEKDDELIDRIKNRREERERENMRFFLDSFRKQARARGKNPDDFLRNL